MVRMTDYHKIILKAILYDGRNYPLDVRTAGVCSTRPVRTSCRRSVLFRVTVRGLRDDLAAITGDRPSDRTVRTWGRRTVGGRGAGGEPWGAGGEPWGAGGEPWGSLCSVP